MNWIGHYLCALPQPSTERAGSVAADLVGIIDRSLKPRKLAALAGRVMDGEGAGCEENKRFATAEGKALYQEMLALLRGMAWHEEVDRHFHRSAFFLSTQSALLAALHAAKGPSGLKRLLPAHVLAEFWFDHALVQKHPQVLAQIQTALTKAHQPFKHLLLLAPQVHQQQVTLLQERVESAEFGAEFSFEQGALMRINRMLPRFRLRPLTEAEEEACLACWHSMKPAVLPDLNGFVAKMQGLALAALAA